jgi:hypothetical protein
MERTRLLVELCVFFMHRKTWWLLPLMVFLLLIGALMAIGEASALAPLIYPLF